MSLEERNLETSRRMFELWNADDWGALRELFADDVTMRHPEGWPEPGPSVGRDAIFRQFEVLRDGWGADEVELLEQRPAGARVVTRHHWRTHGAHSDAATEMTLSAVLRFRDGRCCALDFYRDHSQALAAAGIETGDASPADGPG